MSVDALPADVPAVAVAYPDGEPSRGAIALRAAPEREGA